MTENNLQQIYEELKQLKEENIKFRRLYEDTIYNLDEDNFPGFSKVIRAVNETYENVAQIQGQVNNQGATISQIVTSEIIDGETVYEANASFIISAINGQSAAKINADLIQMTGTVVFLTQSDVGASGTATIHGDRVRLGSLISNNYTEVAGVVTAGMKIDLNNGTIISKNFELDEDGNVEITGIINATAGVIGGSLISMPWAIGTNNVTGVAYLWNRKPSLSHDEYPGIYIGTDGIALGSTDSGGVIKMSVNGSFFTPWIMVRGSVALDDSVEGGFIDIIEQRTWSCGHIEMNSDSRAFNIQTSGDAINLVAPQVHVFVTNGFYVNGVRVY